MKIALCTSDFFYPVHECIRAGGHSVERVYTSCGLDTGFSDKTKAFAEEMRSQFIVGRVTEADVEELSQAGVELLVSAAYDYKVPTPEKSPIRFINVHGSLLPEGRGPWPQPWILLKYPQHAGVTLHTMTQKWDHGDILLQRQIAISETETMETLIGKTLICVKELTTELLGNFYSVWEARRPMTGIGSYWPKPTVEDRTINLLGSVTTINAIHDCFGDMTVFMDPNSGATAAVSRLAAWKEQHSYTPGSLVTVSPPRRVYAALDGFVSLTPA